MNALTSQRLDLGPRAAARLRALIEELSGIVVGEDTALAHKLRGLIPIDQSIEAFEQEVRRDKRLATELIDRVCTHETRFFRHAEQFEFLERHLFPGIREDVSRGRRKPAVRAWSAACSSGEEPFSLAMCLRDAFSEAQYTVDVLGSDVSHSVLRRARQATWPMGTVRKLDKDVLRRHMLRGLGPAEGTVRAKPELRELVRFERINLTRTFRHAVEFDVIFCRNVLYYFSHETRARVVASMVRYLSHGGFLVVSPTESLRLVSDELSTVSPAIYRRR